MQHFREERIYFNSSFEFLKLHVVVMNYACFKIPHKTLKIKFQLWHPKNA